MTCWLQNVLVLQSNKYGNFVYTIFYRKRFMTCWLQNVLVLQSNKYSNIVCIIFYDLLVAECISLTIK